MLTLVSSNSRYDSVQRGQASFSPQQANGYRIFRVHCAACHTEPLFTNNGFASNGLPVDTLLRDAGRMAVTHNHADSLQFKVPSLRNVECSPPYMHDGRFGRLQDVINHYASGIVHGPTLSPELAAAIDLSAKEKVDLLAFLLCLTDRQFLYDSSLSYPRFLFFSTQPKD